MNLKHYPARIDSMRNNSIFFGLLALMIILSGCSKDIESFAEFPAVNLINPTADPVNAPYQIPEVKSASDFAYIIYIDPEYSGPSDGSIERPFTDFNAQYQNGIPSNTAFLFKRGTNHPKIGRQTYKDGRNGDVYYDMVFNNNLFGAYGTGARPVVGGFFIVGNDPKYSSAGTWSTDITIRDLNIFGQSQAGHAWDCMVLLHYGPRNVTIAHNIIEGKFNNSFAASSPPLGSGPYKWPTGGIRSTSINGYLTIFNNQICNFEFDGYQGFGNVTGKTTFVRNYIYNINRANWGKGYTIADQANNWGAGDGIKFSLPTTGRGEVYIAGNYVNPGRDYHAEYPAGHDFHKAALIGFFAFEGGLGTARPITCEHNTFIASPPGNHSTSVIWDPSPGAPFRYNLIDRTNMGNYTRGGEPLAVPKWHHSPVRVTDNHLIKAGSTYFTWPNNDNLLHNSNELFPSWNDYQTFLQTNLPVGSDIDPNNFLKD
jgi:hypothetical protein